MIDYIISWNKTSKYKDKLLILDNASSHRHKKIIYHCILFHINILQIQLGEHFSLLKSKLEKLKYNELKENINKVIIKKHFKLKSIKIIKHKFKQ